MAKKRALISVSDKTGVVEFAAGLTELGYEILSTGGTAQTLRSAGLTVIDISAVTGFGECLDGRVKTLHPAVHGGILAIRDNAQHMEQLQQMGIDLIDVVVINLYPFKETIAQPEVLLENAIENIDIGGPTMIRAAAKNWQDIVVVIRPEDYTAVLKRLQDGTVDADMRYDLACKVFEHTASYDALVASYLRQQQDNSPLFPTELTLTYEKVQDMRYGENPHQCAAFYRELVGTRGNGIVDAEQLQGKALSYNNISDVNAAMDIIKEFSVVEPCAVAVKHANPCGVGLGDTLWDAYTQAFQADPVSIFGGIVAVNREVDEDTAREMAGTFLEMILAPAFSKEAVEIFSAKPNLRLLSLPSLQDPNEYGLLDTKKVVGGLLVQELDTQALNPADLKVVTKRAPDEQELTQLLMAWRVVKHTKSNAIVLFKDRATVGIGPGQTNRITALDIAIRYAGARAEGSVMASDAYFPFSDCVEAAAAAGVTAIIQPGGSVRDEESIQACDRHGIAMICTGMRHFKH